MVSFAEWHLIQFTSDMRRREPKNVGVAATDGTKWRLRLFGVGDSAASALDGRSLRKLDLNKDDYLRWVEYYTTLISDGQIDRIQRSQRRRPTEFRLVNGGQTELLTDLDEFVRRLYQEMVVAEAAPASESHARKLQTRVEQVLTAAEVTPALDVVVPGKWDDTEDDIPFDYGYTNGKLHLMDRLQLHQGSMEQSKMLARDFNARARAVLEAGTANSFIAFYSQSSVDELGSDSVLAPLWRVAQIVDVDDIGGAARDLNHYIYS